MEPGSGIEPDSPAYKAGASPAMLTRRNLEPKSGIGPESVAYHATALPLSYIDWSRSADSNCGLGVTSAPFYPLNYSDWSGRGESNPVSWTGDPALNQ